MKPERKQLTVGELIVVLQKFDPSLLVETEGCDCFGPCVGAHVYSFDREPEKVALERG